VPPKNPIGKIKDAATDAAVTVVGTVTATVKDPIGTGHKVVSTAVGQAVAVAGHVGTRLPGLKRAAAPKVDTRPVAEPQGDPLKPPTKKAAAKKGAAKKTAAKKAPAKKTAAKKAPAKKTAKTAADLAAVDDSSVETPVGTTGADPATNPDTTDHDLQQVGTEPIMDASLTNAIKSEAEFGARAADPDKG
jgi:hypothetical protein